jgi:hypothetical protein
MDNCPIYCENDGQGSSLITFIWCLQFLSQISTRSIFQHDTHLWIPNKGADPNIYQGGSKYPGGSDPILVKSTFKIIQYFPQHEEKKKFPIFLPKWSQKIYPKAISAQKHFKNETPRIGNSFIEVSTYMIVW